MSTKVQLLLACIIALIIMLVVSRPTYIRHTQPAAKGQPDSGIASIQLERQQTLLLLELTFRDPHGKSAQPAIHTEPTFAIVDSTGKEVYHGKFEFG